MSTRSNQPVYWALFGAGGMLAALVGAMLAFITVIALPLELGSIARLATYDGARALLSGVPVRAALFVAVSLFLWHAAHRGYHTLHDFGVRPGRVAWACCYGVASAGTLAALAAVLMQCSPGAGTGRRRTSPWRAA
jgi:fumarate reductase subunit D